MRVARGLRCSPAMRFACWASSRCSCFGRRASIGVGFAGTPASHSLTGSVPVDRAGMASGTADLQRDLGGAIMQSILGAILAVSYAASMGAALTNAPADDRKAVT